MNVAWRVGIPLPQGATFLGSTTDPRQNGGPKRPDLSLREAFKQWDPNRILVRRCCNRRKSDPDVGRCGDGRSTAGAGSRVPERRGLLTRHLERAEVRSHDLLYRIQHRGPFAATTGGLPVTEDELNELDRGAARNEGKTWAIYFEFEWKFGFSGHVGMVGLPTPQALLREEGPTTSTPLHGWPLKSRVARWPQPCWIGCRRRAHRWSAFRRFASRAGTRVGV